MSAATPVVAAHREASARGYDLLRVECPYCGDHHLHGAGEGFGDGDGPRVPHCGGRLSEVGRRVEYILREVPGSGPRHWLLNEMRRLGIRGALRLHRLSCRTCGSPLADQADIYREAAPGDSLELLSVAIQCAGFGCCGTVTDIPWPGPEGAHPLHPSGVPPVAYSRAATEGVIGSVDGPGKL